MQRTDINIDLRIRSRQTGKTTELVSKYFELLTQGKKPCFITVNLNSSKDNIINKMKSINNLENYNDKILNYESINITQFDSFILDDFKYPGRIPQSKESAIVMLADTCEAAVKSLNTTNLDEVEAMIRKVVKHKVELDQLVKTDLSFGDIELIILAFRQVYYGLYHERIKYPE